MLSGTPHTFIGSTTFEVKDLTCAHSQRAATDEIAAVGGAGYVLVP
jgi:hypothetical protein